MIPTPLPLTLAGSDPTGGAGLEADLKVFLRHGLSGTAVATALTTQDTRGVVAVQPVPANAVRRRLELLLADLPIGGIKTGLLPGAAVIRAIAAVLREARVPHLIVDPVLAPTQGRSFLDAGGQRALIAQLLPLCDLLLPNLAEAARLLGVSPAFVRRHPEQVTARLRALGPRAVLLKGGHATGDQAIDLLDDAGTLTPLAAARLDVTSVHGTGCALSAACLARRIQGLTPLRAVRRAKGYVHRAIAASTAPGRGQRLLRFDVRT